VLADLDAIAAVANAHGVPLVCDQAWGAHFGLHPALPPAASRRGVDVSTVSIHKTLTAFTQGAMLHIADGAPVDAGRLDAALDLLTTTSVSGMILASLDEARQLVEARGAELLDSALTLAGRLRDGLAELPGVRCLDEELRQNGRPCDPLRIIVDLSRTGVSGFAVEAHLRRHGVHVQMADAVHVIPLLTIGDVAEHVDRFVDALADALAVLAPGSGTVAHGTGAWRARPEQAATPREAVLARHERVPAERAAGKIAAEIVAPYPPGVPALAPGERITAALLDELRTGVAAGGRISGPTDPSLETMVVVA
jgi:arginine decarboxylase